MKNLAKILLCSLFVPVNMALGFDLYYDVNGVCNASLWCQNKPSAGACCSDGNVVNNLASVLSSHETKDGYIFRGWTKERVGDVYTSAESLDSVLVIDKNGGMKGSISDESTLYPAWAKQCADSNVCQLYVDEYDGHVEYQPLCDSTTQHQEGQGWNLTCEQNTPDDEILSITYSDDGSGCVSFTGNVSTDSCVKGGNYTLWSLVSGQVSVNEGFELTGWVDSGRHTLGLGGSYPCHEDIGTLIAVCKRTYSISYKNGEHGSVNYTGVTTCKGGTSIDLADSNIVTPNTGWTFSGWKIGGDNTVYNSGASVPCNENVSNITAVYTQNPQWVKFVLDNGDEVVESGGTSTQQYFWCQMNSDISGCYGCYKGEACNSVKFEYLSSIPELQYSDFLGYYLTQDDKSGSNSGGGNTNTEGMIIGANGHLTDGWKGVGATESPVTIYAHWKQKTYTVSYDYTGCYGGDVPSGCSNVSKTCQAGESFVLGSYSQNCVDSEGGYSFQNWQSTSSSGDSINTIMCTKDSVVYAKCSFTAQSGDKDDVINLKGFYAN